MAELVPALADFDPLMLEAYEGWTRDKARKSLPQDHPERSEKAKLIAGDHAPSQPVLTYGAVARQFAVYMLRSHRGIIEESGSAPTYPYGPIGLSSDGIVVSLCRTPSGQVNVWAQSVDSGERFFGCWHNNSGLPDDGSIAIETGSRLAAASRAVGEATLRPSMRPGQTSQLGLVEIFRGIDVSATDYRSAYPDAPIAPIGALTGSTTMPIFPLDALINLDIKF